MWEDNDAERAGDISTEKVWGNSSGEKDWKGISHESDSENPDRSKETMADDLTSKQNDQGSIAIAETKEHDSESVQGSVTITEKSADEQAEEQSMMMPDKSGKSKELTGTNAGTAATGERMLSKTVEGVLLIIGSDIWLAGIIAMLAYIVVSFVRMRSRLRTAVRLEVGADVKGWVSDAITEPFVLGIVRPRIYLPSMLEAGDLECVLCHEQAHIKRGDYLWKPFGFLILCVYWFHPLCWISYLLFCRDVEMACDEKATKNFSAQERKRYCQALLNISQGKRNFLIVTVDFGENGTKSRVKAVLAYRKPSFGVILAGMLAGLAVGFFFMTSPSGNAADAGIVPQTSETMEEDFTPEKNSLGAEENLEENSGSAKEDDQGEGKTSWDYGVGKQIGVGLEGWNFGLGDLDENGIYEYVTYGNFYDSAPENILKVYMNGECIYELREEIIDVLSWRYSDFDGDGVQELFLSLWSGDAGGNNNKYVVLKKTDGKEWKTLEERHVYPESDDSFPVQVTYKKYKKDRYMAEITLKGVKSYCYFSLEDYYKGMEKRIVSNECTADEKKALQKHLAEYEMIMQTPWEELAGKNCGSVTCWGYQEVVPDYYNGLPCLIARYGIIGMDEQDDWGRINLWFRYDKDGKVQVLHMSFDSIMDLPIDEGGWVDRREYNNYMGATEGEAYAEIAKTYYDAMLEMRKGEKASYEILDALGDTYVNEWFLDGVRNENDTPVYSLIDLNDDGKEEFLIGCWHRPGLEYNDVYTWKDGVAYLLTEPHVGYRGGSRVVCKNGAIMDDTAWFNFEGSNTRFWRLPPNGTDMEVEEWLTHTLLSFDESEKEVHLYYRKLPHADQIISKEEYEAILSGEVEGYKKIRPNTTELTPESIETLRAEKAQNIRNQNSPGERNGDMGAGK